MSIFVMRRTSSIASTFSGSAMARKRRLSSRDTGSTLCVWQMSRGSNSAISGAMPIRPRFTGGVFSTRPMQTAMSCSVT